MSEAALYQSKQTQWWNGEGAARWLASAGRRSDKARAQFADRAMQAADVKPGESVIEVGCGTGENAIAIAKLVGPTGKVLAIDVSEPILAQGKAELAEFPNVRAIVADASTYGFEPASADLVFSRFGVMFFGDPVAAFANIRKALKPTGRLLFICWRARMEGPMEVVAQHAPDAPPADPEAPGPQSLRDKDRVDRILRAAGFTAPSFEALDSMRDIAGGRGVEGALEAALEYGPIATLLATQSDAVKADAKAALETYLAGMEKDGAVVLPTSAWIVGARPA